MGNAALFAILALAGAGFDLKIKQEVFDRVGPPGSPPVSVIAPVLELRTSHNPGALWGLGQNFDGGSLFFAVLSIAAGAFIVYWLFVVGHVADGKQTAALGLIMAGALGNCHDRLRYGFVRDFIFFHVDSIGFEFPIFNFADSMLVIGAGLLLLLALRADTPAERASTAHQEVAQMS